ncbi:MAG: hypothetical protein IIV62_01915 [Anaerotignum sp.]|nr:hypothetical protein [Anaerotignum sp.]
MATACTCLPRLFSFFFILIAPPMLLLPSEEIFILKTQKPHRKLPAQIPPERKSPQKAAGEQPAEYKKTGCQGTFSSHHPLLSKICRFPFENPLPRNFKRGCALEWQGLEQENAPLRTVISGRLVSVSENFYDHVLNPYGIPANHRKRR